MIKKRYAVVAAGVVGTVLLGTAGSASAITTSRTIDLIGKQTTFHFSDIAPLRKANAGDGFQFTEALSHNGKRVGTSYISCVIIVANKRDLCQVTWELPAGHISGAGTIPDFTAPGTSFNIPVIGGTGQFQNARGQVTLTPANDDSTHEVFHLIP